MTDHHETAVRVLRVFTDETGRHGNALGVIDGALVDQDDRQRVAHELGFSETIFIDDYAHRRVARLHASCRAPARWPSARRRRLAPPGRARRPNGARAAASGRAWCALGPMRRRQNMDRGAARHSCRTGRSSSWARRPRLRASPGLCEPDHDHVVCWAFIETGVLRVRCFAPRFGIAEDEATGSAALLLTALLEAADRDPPGQGLSVVRTPG